MKYNFHLSKLNRSTIYLLLLGVGIGLLTTVQWKTKPPRATNSPVNSYISLVDTKRSLASEQNDLKSEIAQKQNEINDKQKLLKEYTASKNEIIELENYKSRVGLTEIKGQGVAIKIDDSKDNQTTVDSIAHAADLRDLVNFLWSIGAQAISINDERIVYNTSIDCIINTVLINNTKTTVPFSIKVIGDSKIIISQLDNPNNLKDIKKRVKNDGLVFEVTSSKDINIGAYKGNFVIEQAKILEN
jgi:uncharacterized protein YlxW (UPF0749 family)